MSSLENVPGQCGYLVISSDGAVLESKGDLKDDENTAKVMLQMVQSSGRLLCHVEGEQPSLQRVTVRFENFSLVACSSNQRVYVVKRH